jgi:hypothetical protein
MRVTVTEADFVVSAWLVAVRITVCGLPEVGAVYSPVESTIPIPTGLIVQVTAVLLLLDTLAKNCCVWP